MVDNQTKICYNVYMKVRNFENLTVSKLGESVKGFIVQENLRQGV